MLTRPKPAEANVRAGGTARAASDTYSEELYDSPSDWNVVDVVELVAANRGVSMAEIALAWLLSRPGVTAPIVGATRLSHLETAIRATELRLRPDEIEQLEAPYVPHAVRGDN
jgi:aryl-alcohol dehydrogenase-like predicted oxidoreductase